MVAYIIADTKIENPQEYEKYKKLAKPIAEQYGGKYLARGGELEMLEDDLWSASRVVIIEFPDMDAARAFANSKEYAPVKKIRHANAKCTLALVDGG